jgi:hypothetical protein
MAEPRHPALSVVPALDSQGRKGSMKEGKYEKISVDYHGFDVGGGR